MLARQFQAMGSPCEVQVDTDDPVLAGLLASIARTEAERIERKFSRYRADSIVGQINRSAGRRFTVDAETAALLDYADACYRLSAGLFDITSGVLRQAWTFDGSDRVPDEARIQALLGRIGWDKVDWRRPDLLLLPGMEIDLGGLGKEYAVDRAVELIKAQGDTAVLVNFGGDLRVSGPRRDGTRWRVLIEGVESGQGGAAWLEIDTGAITTSGDARRYVLRDGQRYGHILDPRSGMPISSAPRAITVYAGTCLEAGICSTLAMLQGAGAEEFLRTEGVKAWVTR